MITAKSIPSEHWIHARKCLVYYFTRRLNARGSHAEDLAQETLLTVWQRDDFQFEKEEDFLKVCYGFARKVLQGECREQKKYEVADLNDLPESTIRDTRGLRQTEMALFLEEVRSRAEDELSADEWALIKAAVNREFVFGVQAEANKQRVVLHRARKKLAKFTGW